MSSTALSPFSSSVTRVLELSGFPPELKTRDIQGVFAKWEDVKIKWVDDTTALLVFADAAVAKRAYLSTLAYPPPLLSPPNSNLIFKISPYDKPDAGAVIQAVQARAAGRGRTGSSISSLASVLPPPTGSGLVGIPLPGNQQPATGIGLAGGPAVAPPGGVGHVRRLSSSSNGNGNGNGGGGVGIALSGPGTNVGSGHARRESYGSYGRSWSRVNGSALAGVSEGTTDVSQPASFALPPLHKQASLGSLISSSFPGLESSPPTDTIPLHQPPPQTSSAIPIVPPSEGQSSHFNTNAAPFVPRAQGQSDASEPPKESAAASAA